MQSRAVTLAFALLIACLPAYLLAADAVLTWEAPIKNIDGTNATDLFGYNVYRRCSTSGVAIIASVKVPAITYTDTQPDDGRQCWYSLTALDSVGNASVRTNEVTKIFAAPAAMIPNGVVASFTWTNTTTQPSSFAAGFNFRATKAFATDPVGTQFVGLGGVGQGVYPTTSGGATFGFIAPQGASEGSRDRVATGDARTVGFRFADNAATSTFRIDLPARNCTIRLAVGDRSYPHVNTVKIMDGAVAFTTLTAVSTVAGGYMDANGATYATSASWVSGNTPLQRMFGSNFMQVQIGGGANGTSTALAHLQVSCS